MMIRVFLVEDDPLVAMMLEGYLDVLGHEIVVTAATVAEALDLVAKRDFDLAILDVHLACFHCAPVPPRARTFYFGRDPGRSSIIHLSILMRRQHSRSS